MSPSPTWRHQGVAGALYALLLGALPGSDLRVFMAPLDVPIADDTVMQPDLLVVARNDLGAKWPTAAPLLAVEVLSPSTQRFDLHLKHSRYEAAGTSAYWVIDPSVPSLRAWELRDGSYVEVAHVVGAEPFEATSPYPVRVVPADLVED